MKPSISFLRALLLAAIATPACGGSTDLPTGSTTPSNAGAGGTAAGGQAGQGGASGSGTSGQAGQATAGAAGSAAGAGGGKAVCVAPEPIVVGGQDTGYERCQSGEIHRREIKACPVAPPSAAVCPQSVEGGTCKFDADCKDAPNGHCVGADGGEVAPGCYCSYGCTQDSDCGTGSICLCGKLAGRCVASTCQGDQDCGGLGCSSYGVDQLCNTFAFACQNPADQCQGSDDCKVPALCLLEGDHRVCKNDQPCAIGRPLLVEQALRQAALVRGGGWG